MKPPLTLNAWLRYDVVDGILCRLQDVDSILEVGTGQGAVGSRLAEHCRYLGVEPDRVSFEVARDRIEGDSSGEVRCGDIRAVLEEEIFDLVCAFEVLEHIEDDESALRAWRRHLRPGGWVLLSVPAYEHRFAAADVHVGHLRRYNPAQIETLLARCGFEHVSTFAYGFPLGYALEWIRNFVARRRSEQPTVQSGTSISGRFLQPSELLGWWTAVATYPFRLIQGAFLGTGHGPGLVILGRRRKREDQGTA